MQDNGLIILSPVDLGLAAGLVLLLAMLSWQLRLNIGRRMLIAAARSTVQLLLLGLVLKALFNAVNPWLVGALALLIAMLAGWRLLRRCGRGGRSLV